MHTNQLDLLPTAPDTPAWPAMQTLPAEALRRLLDGERLTQITFGSTHWRLAVDLHGILTHDLH
jgi:hypothetical protein